jgi:hypothetical protein
MTINETINDNYGQNCLGAGGSHLILTAIGVAELEYELSF